MTASRGEGGACTSGSYDECMYSTIAGLMKSATGDEHCTSPWVIDDARICKRRENIDRAFRIAWTRSVGVMMCWGGIKHNRKRHYLHCLGQMVEWRG